jgi:hypothetical protein
VRLRDKSFAADLKELKHAIRDGACTISEARPARRTGAVSTRERRAGA